MKQNNYCRYGANCRRNQHGNCSYRHRRDELLSKDNQKSVAKAHYRERERSRSYDHDKDRKKHKDHKAKYYEVDRKQQTDYKRHSSKSTYYKYQEKSKYEQKCKHSDYYGNSQHSNNRSLQRLSTPQLPYERDFNKFCRSYHLQDMCDDKHNCSKIHGFLFKNNERFRRRIFKKSDKFTKDVKLSLSINNQTQTINYVTKNKKQVTFYKYTPAINILQEITTNTLQNNSTPQTQYFGCEGATLYFSFTNKDSLSDLTCYELTTSDCFSIKSAHYKDVTGMVHLNQQNIITTSLDGAIKIWSFDKVKYQLGLEEGKSLEFKNHFNPQDKKMELYFIQKHIWGQKQLVCVGTSDSRLLIFINEHPLNFTEIIVSQSQLKIVKMKKINNKKNESFQILVLAHSKDKSEVYKISIDGINEVKKEKLIELELIEGRRINTFQAHQELLIVSYGTESIIYEMNEKVNIIGGIIHHSPVKSLTITECYLKTTGVSIYVLAILQGASSSEKQDGLLSFYFIR